MCRPPCPALACRFPLGSLLALGLLLADARAANRYFDTSNASGLTPGSAVWNVGGVAAWAASASPGTAAPLVWANGNDAFFQTGGANLVTLSGAVAANSITQTTAGTLTTISGASLQLGNGSAGTLANTGNSPFTLEAPLALSGNLTVNAASAVVLRGAVGGAFSLTKSGAGTLAMSGTNTYTGATTVTAGNLALGGIVNGGLGRGSLLLGNGGAVRAEDDTARAVTNILQVGTANVGDNGVFTLGPGGDLTFGSLVLETANHRTLTVDNTETVITGGLTHGNRFLSKAGSGALVILGTADTGTGGMVALAGMVAVTGVSGGMNATEELKLNGGVFGANGTFSRGLGSGAGQVQWAARDETGNATASGGFAARGPDPAWGARGNALTVNLGGAAAALTWGGTAHFVSGGILRLGHARANGTVTFVNPVNLNGKIRTVAVGRSDFPGAGVDAVLSGVISNGSLVKAGDGVLSLAANNTYAGRTTVSSGTLSLAFPYLANGSDVFLSSSSVLDLAHGQTDVIDQLVVDGVVQATGTWGSLTSAATHKAAFLSGPGLLQVNSQAPVADPPSVENLPASAVTTVSATLTAEVLDTGLETPLVSIYYGTTDGGTSTSAWQNVVHLGGQTGVVSTALSGLEPFTTYYFRAYARNSLGADWADATGSFQTLVAFHLTEALTVNTTGLLDEDATPQPWLEIWNPDPARKFSLNGYRLVLGADSWTFPSVEILPDERLLVFASGKNRLAATAPPHTSFALGPAGGSLELRQPGGIVDSVLPIPALAANTSFGRDYAERSATGVYTSPTPGDANNYSGAGVSGKVALVPPAGAFSGSQSVTIQAVTPAPGAEIRYTLDGSPPRAASPLYTTPISLSDTTLVRARVFEPGKLPGEIESAGHLRIGTSTTAFSGAVPVVVVSNFGKGTFPDTGDQPAYFWVWMPAAPDARARLTNPPALVGRCAVDRRGSSTLGNAKTNFNLEARKARDDDDRDLALLGLPAGSDWVFHAPYSFDRSLLHNPLAYALGRAAGRYATRHRMAEVYVKTSAGELTFTGGTSGDYFGLYNVLEKIRRDDERVDLARLDTFDNDAVGKSGGYIWKVDRTDAGDTGFNAAGTAQAYYYPNEMTLKTPQRDPQEQYLTSYLNAFKTALDGANFTDPVLGYAGWFDPAPAVDHHLVSTWAFNVDALRLSCYLQKDRGARFTFGPVWDFDRALSSTDGRDANPLVWRSTVSDLGTDFFNYSWWNRLFRDPDFYQRYIDRWVELRRGAWSDAAVNALIDSLQAELTDEAVARDLARWNQTKRAWTSPFTGTVYPASQAAEIQRLKDYLRQRAGFFDSQWVAPVTFSLVGGGITPGQTLTLSGPPGATVYYTLNGADPRPSGGAAPSAPQVFTYSAPIPLNATTKVTARAHHPAWTALTGANNPPLVSTWSAPTTARFSVDAPAAPGDLAITEIHYHPSDPSPAELAVNPRWADGDFEFLEFKNIADHPIDLAGITVADGVAFTLSPADGITLAPGGFAVLVANPQAFAARYPGVANVLGPYSGDVSNGGERILLLAAGGAVLADPTYDDAWYPESDGPGRSLAVFNARAPSADFSLPANWRASAAVGGSPGADEPNLAPWVDAGPDAVGYLPSAALSGTVREDSLPSNQLAVAWSAPGSTGLVSFADAADPATTAIFAAPGVFSLRLSASDGVLSAEDEVTLTMRDTPGAWAARHPGIGGLNDDPDGDGAINWLEWAMDTDPLAADAGLVGVFAPGGFAVEYTRHKDSPFAAYVVQASDDPGVWRDPLPGEIEETILADDGVRQTVRAVDTLSPGRERRVVRLKILPTPE